MSVTYPGAGLFPGATTFPGNTFVGALTFRPPTREVAFRLERGLFATTAYGLSVWRTAGTWQQGFIPTAEQVAAADRFYGGGRVHSISAAERADLVAGGFGAYITEETS